MASIAKLVVSLGANVAGFETDMTRATRNQQKRMRQMQREVEAAGRAIGVAFAAAAGSMTVLVRNTTKAADEMNKLGGRLGASTESLSQLKYAAELSGVEFRTLEMGLQRMTRRIGEVAFLGKGEAKEALQVLGLEAKALAELPLDQQFETIAEELSKVTNASQRTSLAMKLFDSEGVKLVQIMGDGAKGIQQMREEADRLGLTIGQEFANNATAFADNMERIKAGFTGAANQLTAALLPALLDLQTYFLGSDTSASSLASTIGEKLGSALKTLTAAFVIVKNAALGFGKILLGTFDLLVGIAQTTIAPLTGALKSLVNAFAALKAGDLSAAAAALGEIGSNIGQQFEAAAQRIKTAGGFILETVGNIDDGLDEVNKVFNTVAKTTTSSVAPAFKTTGTEVAKTARALEDTAEAADNYVEVMSSMIDELDELNRGQEEYERTLQSILDTYYPLQAEGRRVGAMLAVLETALRRGDITAEQFEETVRRVTEAFGEFSTGAQTVAGEVDYLAEIMLEAARQLERTFSDIFTGIIDGALDAWGAIERGFQTLVTNIAQNPIRVIVADVQKAFGPGGGGLADLDLKKLGGDLITSIGNIVGLSSADSLYGQIGSTVGSIAGKILATKFLTALGSFAGPIGSAIGAILGSLIGDWVGGLFERELAFTLGGTNRRTRGDNQQIRTPLGDILGLSGQGGFGSLNDPSTLGGQLAKVLTEFDTQIANIFKEVGLDDATFQAVTDSLENWVASFGENADAVDVLASRFNVILGNFSADIQDFVRGADDFEGQIERFGVALAADKLIKDNQDIFGDRTTGELLAIVEQFQRAGESIGEAFQRFIPVLESVISVTATLRDFASSDPLADLDALINPQSLEQSLANVNGAILDLITNFDGSIEQLQAIGELSLVARQGELQLLQQIDSIQKGLTERLQSLRDFVTGADQAPKSIAKVLAEAEGLILQVGNAQSSADVARIGGEFDALIRSLSPEQLGIAEKDILSLITLFDEASSGRLSTIRDNTLDNAVTVRDAVDTFVTEIGDPLDIIAASLEGANLSESLNEGFESVNQNQTENTDRLIAAILESGEVTVNVVVQDTGLVTQ